MSSNERKKPSFLFVLLIMAAVCVVVIVPYMKWGISMATTFFLSWLFVIPTCMSLGFTYEEPEKAAVSYHGKIITSAFILLSVGGMIGAWIAAGIVSVIVDVELRMIASKIFLLVAFIVGVSYAMACGTSWGTLGTVSIAMSAVGLGLGVPPAMTVGAVVSAAFLGDDFPLVLDSPNLASAITEVELMDHVRHLAEVQLPAFIINAALYTILGFVYAGGEVQNETTLMIIKTLGDNYNVGLIVFLPALIVIILLLLKKSAIISILISAATGIGVTVIYQGKSLAYVLTCFWSGVKSDAEMRLADTLLSRGGVTSPFSSTSPYLITFGFTGILTQADVPDAMVALIVNKVKTGFQLLITTIITGSLGDATGCPGSFAHLFAGNLMKPLYKKMNVSDLDLTRNLACSVTPLGPLIPWNMNAVIILDLLGVSCSQYAPYCFQAYVVPVLLIVNYLLFNKRGGQQNGEN